jgi:hypothetical protein
VSSRLKAADDFLDEALLVFGIQDLEALRQPASRQCMRQQPVADAVKRADPERRRGHAELRFDAVAHLGRGLVRERDGEDAVRRDALDLHEPLDAVREHSGLAAACAREHERGLQRGSHGLTLRVVERREYVGDVHREVADSTGLRSPAPAGEVGRRPGEGDDLSAYAAERSRAARVRLR